MKLQVMLINALIVSCLMAVAISCSSSTLVDVWNDTSYHATPLKKMLIIAVRRDPVQRRIWEDAFANELSGHDVQATASYNLFPNAVPDTAQVVKSISENSFDGILVTRVLHKQTETHSVDSSVSPEYVTRYNPFRKTYTTYLEDVTQPAYVDSQTVDRRAIEVWAVKDPGQLIWGATSNTPERNSAEAVQNDIADLVITQLVRNSIISGK